MCPCVHVSIVYTNIYIYVCIYILKFVYKLMYCNVWGSIHVYIYRHLYIYRLYMFIHIYACMSTICRFNNWFILDPPLCRPWQRVLDLLSIHLYIYLYSDWYLSRMIDLDYTYTTEVEWTHLEWTHRVPLTTVLTSYAYYLQRCMFLDHVFHIDSSAIDVVTFRPFTSCITSFSISWVSPNSNRHRDRRTGPSIHPMRAYKIAVYLLPNKHVLTGACDLYATYLCIPRSRGIWDTLFWNTPISNVFICTCSLPVAVAASTRNIFV